MHWADKAAILAPQICPASTGLPYLLGIFRGSHSLASSMKMQPSAEVAKRRVSSDPMRSRSTAALKHLYSWKSPVSGSL